MKLCEMCSINMGQSPDSSSYNEEGNGMPFYQGNADFGEIHPVTRVWCTEPTKTAHPDDILMSVRAPIGALNIANEECCIGRGLAAITVDSKVCTRQYLWYALESKKEELISKGTGSTFKAICKNVLFETEIPFVPLDKQRKIERILDKITRLIADRKKQLSLFDELTASRFLELFGDFDLTYQKQDWKPISDIGTVVGGSTPKTNVEEYWNGEYRWISPAELQQDSGVIYESVKKITKAGIESCSLQELPVGTVILSSRAPIGKVAIAGNTFYCNQGFKNIVCKEVIRPRYLYSLLLFNTEYLNSLGRGATFKEISKSIVESIKIPVPKIEKQIEFEDFVEHLDKSKFYARLCIDLHQNERMRIIP